MTETELMPRWVVGNTELGGSKLKCCKGFSTPNSEPFPSPNSSGADFSQLDEAAATFLDVSFSQPIMSSK